MRLTSVKITDAEIVRTLTVKLTSGIVKDICCSFSFDDSWGIYAIKTAHFKGSGIEKYQTIIDGVAVIPWECMVKGGGDLEVSASGVTYEADEHTVNIRRTTNYCSLGPIFEGADPNAGESTEATPTVAELAQAAALAAKAAQVAAELAKSLSEQIAGDVTIQSNTATEKAAIALAQAIIATGAANNAKTSEENAKISETTTAQTMADFLRMIGIDICNLVNGKVPVDKIPLSVTFNSIDITSESELTTLTTDQVQKNDIAGIIEGTGESKRLIKSYQLKGDGDPSIRANWVELAVNYASISAYATTAGTAENANTINGHRLVEMTTEAFETAVRDPEAYYIVG